MQAKFIDSNMINSDLGVVNAARVSLHKSHTTFDPEADMKLIKYLAEHNHWTPFAHSRLYFRIKYFPDKDRIFFYENANTAGFKIIKVGKQHYIKGSLYGFAKNLGAFQNTKIRERIIDALAKDYPISTQYFVKEDYPTFVYDCDMTACAEDYIAEKAKNENSEFYELLTATLLIRVPIFIARQIRTSQVGFFYSDNYVENEAFVFNEVSRRYVNYDLEFYEIEEWRVREGKSIKQGSTGILKEQTYPKFIAHKHIVEDLTDYKELDTAFNIAPEQLRSFLGLNLYTEFYMTATLHRWAQFIALRSKEDVQEETRFITSYIAEQLSGQYPHWSNEYHIIPRFE